MTNDDICLKPAWYMLEAIANREITSLELTERFIERARNHFRADRFTEALMDLDRAEAGEVKKEEIAELRGYVRTVMAEQQRRNQSRAGRVDAARKRIEGGSLAAGRRILEQTGDNDLDVRQLRRAVDERVPQHRHTARQEPDPLQVEQR